MNRVQIKEHQHPAKKKERSLQRLSAQRDFCTDEDSGKKGKGVSDWAWFKKKKKNLKNLLKISLHPIRSAPLLVQKAKNEASSLRFVSHHLLFNADGSSNVAAWLSGQPRRIGSSWVMCSQHSDPAQILV